MNLSWNEFLYFRGTCFAELQTDEAGDYIRDVQHFLDLSLYKYCTLDYSRFGKSLHGISFLENSKSQVWIPQWSWRPFGSSKRAYSGSSKLHSLVNERWLSKSGMHIGLSKIDKHPSWVVCNCASAPHFWRKVLHVWFLLSFDCDCSAWLDWLGFQKIRYVQMGIVHTLIKQASWDKNLIACAARTMNCMGSWVYRRIARSIWMYSWMKLRTVLILKQYFL